MTQSVLIEFNHNLSKIKLFYIVRVEHPTGAVLIIVINGLLFLT